MLICFLTGVGSNHLMVSHSHGHLLSWTFTWLRNFAFGQPWFVSTHAASISGVACQGTMRTLTSPSSFIPSPSWLRPMCCSLSCCLAWHVLKRFDRLKVIAWFPWPSSQLHETSPRLFGALLVPRRESQKSLDRVVDLGRSGISYPCKSRDSWQSNNHDLLESVASTARIQRHASHPELGQTTSVLYSLRPLPNDVCFQESVFMRCS